MIHCSQRDNKHGLTRTGASNNRRHGPRGKPYQYCPSLRHHPVSFFPATSCILPLQLYFVCSRISVPPPLGWTISSVRSPFQCTCTVYVPASLFLIIQGHSLLLVCVGANWPMLALQTDICYNLAHFRCGNRSRHCTGTTATGSIRQLYGAQDTTLSSSHFG